MNGGAGIALVTGAASGIGLAVATRLLAQGDTVVLCDRDAPALDRAVAGLQARGHAAFGHPCDVADRAAVTALVTQLEAERGPIAKLALVAGILRMGRITELAPQALEDCLDVNLIGLFNVMQAALPSMIARRQGALVTVASNAARTPRIGMGAYAASKAAAVALTKCLGLEVAGGGIRCNTVSPGSTDTPMQRSLWTDTAAAARVIDGDPGQYKLGIPLQRIADPDDIAQAVCFLLSEDARHITLQDLCIDGGATL